MYTLKKIQINLENNPDFPNIFGTLKPRYSEQVHQDPFCSLY